jgi:4-hydroxy-3-polyprenylbenzoate decarboxylase
MGEEVMRFECGVSREHFPDVQWHEQDNMFSEIASGSSAADTMVVVPCSINTLSCLAHGISGNLLQRAAAVTLKEKRKLILVPRETPVDSIALESMLTLSKVGATILPASPGFYYQPKTIDDLVNHVVGKILNLMNIPHELFHPWTDPNTTQPKGECHANA